MAEDPAATLPVRVARIRRETEDVRSFELVSADGAPLPAFSAGAHIDVHLGAALVRPYSLCNGPADTDRYTIGVKREPRSRGASAALHERVVEGDLLRIGRPRNHFPLHDGDAPGLLLAAGIGITPLLSMARHLLAREGVFSLHHFARSAAQSAFHGVLAAPALAPHVAFHWGLDANTVTARLRSLLAEREAGAQLYLCGPRAFMDAVQDAARAAWPADAVHLEHFGGEAAADLAPGDRFLVRLARRGLSCTVEPGQSVVQALQARGIALPVACEQGVCGTCLTRVLAGRPAHRDAYLSEAERQAGDCFLPCVSRSLDPVLVLDA
ncbi:PDR/VanB family oxidoreductase [Piscinibacter sakaiensis]|uniref:Flavodoxin reductase (Ferredoxin-NADPH reductase) family 1 n=1 Tax=Piscinibacter sakaiensis TaxID=1547922 RepID=A0A0K8P6H3_PISS1|nr:PDR/VanB family oxidoreductase [Piscinibacter sakaiensis]GAP38196.1 flavodoxin reductase (ferredoxin-NADPH reductase) family 1 [Piscinibacter sakaiensis]